ncbi:MAG TPA: DUF2071 domain-containing protein [Chthoniobacterales bacterium]
MSLTIRQRLQRHPLPVVAFFRHSLVLTYALPREVLQPLLPPGLVLDSLGDFAFVAIAMVQTESLRPAFLPAVFGQDFFLCGYRIFTRFTNRAGRRLRGLKILRSDTDRARMVTFGNLLTHYQYRLAGVVIDRTDSRLEIKTSTPEATADLHVVARLDDSAGPLPPGSPFRDWHQARLFAGPLPFTFDYEPETHSLVLIEGVREKWHPVPTSVKVLRNTFFSGTPFRGTRPLLASAFRVENVAYRWKRGTVEPLERAA